LCGATLFVNRFSVWAMRSPVQIVRASFGCASKAIGALRWHSKEPNRRAIMNRSIDADQNEVARIEKSPIRRPSFASDCSGRAPFQAPRGLLGGGAPKARQRLTLGVLVIGLAVSPAVAADDNPCVPNVTSQFFALNRHADTSGFYAGLFSGDTECWSDCGCISHYQGIVRGPGPGVPHLYISKNNDPEILIVRMGSRDTDGERLRSNRLAPNFTTEFTWPPFGDGEVSTVRFDDLNAIGLSHAGSMQVIGKTLAVPIDCHGWLLDPCDKSLPIQGVLALLDLSNPEWPFRYYSQVFPHTLGGTAIAKLPDDGRYLLLAAGGPGASLTAFISNHTDLHQPGLFFEYAGQWFSQYFGIYEGNFSIVKQCDGQLYVIGTYNPGNCYNPFQRADLWKLNIKHDAGGIGSFSLDFVASIILSCGNPVAGIACDFQAAAGTYVSPSGELIIYGTVHQQGDPFTAFSEFRRRDIVHPTAQPWVQLYSETSGWNAEFGQSIIFDLPDRHKDDFLNFTLLDSFHDSASSVRWWAPAGCCIELIDNPCFTGSTGTVLTLEGNGQVGVISNLANTPIGDNNVSAIRFCFDAVEPYGCYLPETCPAPACHVAGPDLIVLGIDADPCVNRGQSIPGAVTIQNIGNEPAFGFMDIGFSLSIDSNPSGGGDDIPMGILDLNLNPPLQPGATRSFSFNTLLVPNSATLTMQKLFACVDLGLPPCGMICEACEGNNCSSMDVQIALPDVAVTDIAYPSPVVSGDLVPVTVTIQNFGCNPVCNTVTACIGVGPGSNCITEPYCIEPFDTVSLTINVLAPLSPLNCGALDNFSISACLNFFDANNGNNCRSETISIVEEYWDLDFTITSGDNSVGLGDTLNYNVVVTNVGNARHPLPGHSACAAFITGVNCSPGPGQWGCMLVGDTFTSIGTVQPGQTKTFNFSFNIPNCCAPPIIIGQQWLKAEILYTQGEACDDDCGEGIGNNFHQEPIQITY